MKNKILISIASLLLLAGVYASAKTIIMKINLKDGSTRYLNTEVVDEFNFTEIDEIPEGPQQSFTVSFEYEKAWYHEDLGLAPDFKAVVIEEALPNGVNSTITYTLKSKGNFTNDIVMVQEGESGARISRQNTGYIHPQYGEIWVADQRTYAEEVLGQTYRGGKYPTAEDLECVYYAPKYADGKTFAVYAKDKILPRQYNMVTLKPYLEDKYDENASTIKVRISFNNNHLRPVNIEGVYGYAQERIMIEENVYQSHPEWLTFVEGLNTKFDKGEYNFSLKGNDTELVFDVPNDNLWSIYFKYTYRDAEDNEGITAGTGMDMISVQMLTSYVAAGDDEWSPWRNVGYGYYILGPLFRAGEISSDIEERQSKTNPDISQYRVQGYDYLGPYMTATLDKSVKYTKLIDGNFSPVEFYGATGGTYEYHDDDVNLTFTDMWTYLREELSQSEEEAENTLANLGLERSYYNPEEGRFYLTMIPYNSEGYYQWGTEIMQLGGAFGVYQLKASYSGCEFNSAEKVIANFNISTIRNIGSYTYELRKGALTEEEARAAATELADNPSAPYISTTERAFGLTIDEDGTYTLVLAGYNLDGEKAKYTYITFEIDEYKKLEEQKEFEKNFESLGYTEFTDVFVSPLYGVDAYSWEVEVLKSRTTPGLYCLYNPYKAWPFAEYGNYILPGNHFIMINAEDPDFVYIPKSNTGACLNSNEGEIIAYSRAAYALDEGSSKEDVKDYAGSLKDGVIYFPENSLLGTIESYGDQFFPLPGQLSIDLNNLVSSAKVKAQKAPAVRSIEGEFKLKELQPVNGESATSTATDRIVLVKDAKLMSKDEFLKF